MGKEIALPQSEPEDDEAEESEPEPEPEPEPDAGSKKYKAQYDYAAQDADELSFNRGDILDARPCEGEEEWLEARFPGTNDWGQIPKNYVKLFTSAQAPKEKKKKKKKKSKKKKKTAS